MECRLDVDLWLLHTYSSQASVAMVIYIITYLIGLLKKLRVASAGISHFPFTLVLDASVLRT